jgi:outer membrane lipoprotein SlyB
MAPETVVYGVVRAVKPIRIRRGTADAMLGGTGGAVGGGGIGAIFGGVKGAIVGALAGGALGAAVGIRQTVPGVLVTVGFANSVQAFPQPLAKKEKPFYVGELVQVLEGRRFDRVMPR